MRKILICLLGLFCLAGCKTQTNVVSETNNAKYSYLALGDSYTIGESVAENERWPVQLTENLKERGFQMAAPKIIAKTGWTTRNLIKGIDNELNVQRDFDLVSILIGVNNQYQEKSIGEYEEELRTIFRKAVNHSRTREAGVFAVSIPDYGYTPFGSENQQKISAEIDRFNAVFRRIAEEFKVDFYNITPISREAKGNPNLVADDGLHPSGLMYRSWVSQFADDVAEKLR